MKSLLDWFTPSELAERQQMREGRRAIVLAAAVLLWAPVFGPTYYLFGSPIGGLIIGVAAIGMLGAMLSLKYTKSVSLTGNLCALVVFSTMVSLAMRTSGPGSPSLWWLLSVPMIGIVVCGLRTGISWAALCTFACFAFLLNERWNLVELASDIGVAQMRILNTMAAAGIILCAFSITFAFKITEDSARAELERARRQSDAANIAKSQFLANMSHEIRTPMNAVIGLTELVLDSNLTEKQRDYLTTVLDSGESLLSLINEILDFSKIEAGKIELESVPFRLSNEFDEVKRALTLRADQKQLKLISIVDDDVPDNLIGDPTRLRQVLVNLMSNAIKFTDVGSVKLSASCQSVTAGRVTVAFEVADTGTGIPPEKLNTIFSEFEQADSSTTRRFGGTGLGLAICSRLVSLMGGNLNVESELGTGSKFRFTIELCRDPRNPSQAQQPEPGSTIREQAMDHSSHGLRILLAEDGLANQKLALGLLQRWGHHVEIADNGQIAFDLWQDGQFDLILMDIQMPELDGIGATKLIRDHEQENGGHTPIVALTAHAFSGDRDRCLAAGMDGYTTKPIRRHELAQQIASLVSKPL